MLFRSIKLALLFVVAALHPCTSEQQTTKKTILSFGGNGMIGSAVLARLIEDGSYELFLVSRGNWPFDSKERIKPHVQSIICDRDEEISCDGKDECDNNNSLHACNKLMDVIERTDEFYAVLDFSGLQPKWIEDAIGVLAGKVRVYIYVSTDSVYEVSEGAGVDVASNRRGESVHRLHESQAIRPKDPGLRQLLNEMDEYGDEKLMGEEVLHLQKNETNGFPYVVLRFADVIGPRDGTERYILYHIWIKYYHDVGIIPISVPADVAAIQTSVTYVEDATTAIISAMNSKETWNEVYNIACEEDFNVVSAIKHVAAILGIDGIGIKAVAPEESFAIYPSVRRGPIDISKAREALKFIPTPLEEALRKTVEWYEDLFVNDEEYRARMLGEFITEVIDGKNEDAIEELLYAVGQELGIDYEVEDDTVRSDL